MTDPSKAPDTASSTTGTLGVEEQFDSNGVGVTAASGCVYGSKTYSEGSIIDMQGTKKTCTNGAWF